MEGFGTFLLVVGGILFLVGGIITLVGLKNWNRRSRILNTPTTPIMQAPGGSLVEIKGRIAPSEQGLVQSPFSQRQAVWVRVTVEELRSSGRSTYWATILKEADARPFLVDDGSGQVARIEPKGAEVVLDVQNVGNSGTFNSPPPELQHFLASRGLSTTSWFGFNKSMRYNEELLVAGDTIYALGPSRRVPGPPGQDAYRSAQTNQLTLFAGTTAAEELLVTNKSETELVNRLSWGFVGGLITAGVGVLSAVGGLLLIILDNI